jgi:hypothetical protein
MTKAQASAMIVDDICPNAAKTRQQHSMIDEFAN